MDLPTLGGSDAASALIRAWCGWHVAPVVEQTITLDTREGAAVLLPSLRVVDVIACTYDGVDILPGLEWSADGMIRYPFRRKFRSLTVTLRHGFDIEDVAPIVERVASRLTTQEPGVTQTQKTAGPFQQTISYASAGAGLLAEDRESLRPYKLTWGI